MTGADSVVCQERVHLIASLSEVSVVQRATLTPIQTNVTNGEEGLASLVVQFPHQVGHVGRCPRQPQHRERGRACVLVPGPLRLIGDALGLDRAHRLEHRIPGRLVPAEPVHPVECLHRAGCLHRQQRQPRRGIQLARRRDHVQRHTGLQQPRRHRLGFPRLLGHEPVLRGPLATQLANYSQRRLDEHRVPAVPDDEVVHRGDLLALRQPADFEERSTADLVETIHGSDHAVRRPDPA
ncbi:hypothetical protein Atai01_56830 [Amycolatopsis taiwanensis]|uniref:Uncharacterized protein n=1 Tax=Amycolatopsis taiwanensis TaxID=342230 RepID=A0A9W6R3Z8_9PSEU|nr:hypothetical protein Atai01_56830 [Amycolatopsis taiwanensis]